MKKKKQEEISNVEIKILFNRDKHEKYFNELAKNLITRKIKCNSFDINIAVGACRPINYPDIWGDE